jgi:predicted SAM-dependent methyltransferase
MGGIMYNSETEKIRPRIQKYLQGRILDIGSGHDKITPYAFSLDIRKEVKPDYLLRTTEDIYNLPLLLPEHKRRYDVIFSSHCLEHLEHDSLALLMWEPLLTSEGVIILYLPDARWYDNSKNPEHLHSYTYQSFIDKFSKGEFLDKYYIVEAFEDQGEDRYSFCVIIKPK